MRIKKIIKNKGFTMVELLVVISIIGILATLILANYNAARSRARDTQRKSDLKQYQTALESYASNNSGLYVGSTSAVNVTDYACDYLDITICPEDPHYDDVTGVPAYRYQTFDGVDGTPSATTYVIWADLESSNNWWVLCSGGGVGESSIEPTLGNCPTLN